MRLYKLGFALAGVLGINTAFAAITCTTINSTLTTNVTDLAAPTTCGLNTDMGINPSTIGGASGVTGWQQGAAGGIGIYGLQVGAANTGLTVSVGAGAAFIPEVLVAGPNATCQDSDAYVNDNTANTVGAAVSVTLPNGLAAGTYWIFVGDVTGGTGDAGCGTFSLTVAGTLPVKLEQFSVD